MRQILGLPAGAMDWWAVGLPALVFVGDVLFHGAGFGLNMAIFVLFLAMAITGLQRRRHRGRVGWVFYLPIGVGTLALAEAATALSLLIAYAGLAGLAIAPYIKAGSGVLSWLVRIGAFAATTLPAAFGDVRFVRRLGRVARGPDGSGWLSVFKHIVVGTFRVKSWIVPVLLGWAFLLLFSKANPLMAAWLHTIFSTGDVPVIEARRLGLWLALLLIGLHFLRLRHRCIMPSARTEPVDHAYGAQSAFVRQYLPRATMVWSLVGFNALFAVQTLLDMQVRWTGEGLPEGMTYADFAQRSAFALIVAVVMAAGFILIATHRRKDVTGDRVLFVLILLWVGQNVLLTVSSIERLWLYASVYALTYWRVAAFIWMGLVAAGLVTIVWRLWRKRSNGWLINANVVNVLVVLGLCSLIDFGNHIAWFNVRHSYEINRKASPLDVKYLTRIGPSALPALVYFERKTTTEQSTARTRILMAINRLEAKLGDGPTDWRQFSHRKYRIRRQLSEVGK